MTVTASGGSTVRLHRLTMVAEDEGVMVGRPDIASYAMFPEEGAQALRMLDSGQPVAGVAAWYEQTCGEPLDVEDFLEALEELQFLLPEGEEAPVQAPLRWRRLGRWTFSWPAWLCYGALTVAALVAMVRHSWLRPSYHDVFFTEHLALIPITLTVVQIPCILLHEGYHALSGRRLGLPSRLTISRRMYYLVAETQLDSLFSVPRRRRYLPFLAGMLSDAVLMAGLTLLALLLRGPGVPAWCPALCLAVSFTCVMRMIWQFMFYLRTDLYYVLTNALRCSELHDATRFYLRTRFQRLLGRTPSEPDADADWTERDRAMARVYAPFLVAGYGFSLGSLLWAGIPTTVHFCTLIIDRFRGSGTATTGILDAVSFVGLTSLQFGLLLYVAVRDRRARKASTQGALS
ncbi:hypothetical protein P3T36_003988 [Kitasatospora sp. MAP12-15]|uniref:hypothetical protein n=1 Tax=unclassified Kitasatospora TaxID=2633591 RepID=UPI0024742913|nr:hypothetical protein [Kitasatospora sp. MAP12-44]MDH6108367.1 hypothetical protein [Kitasatospora sp. MAP12-44]